MDADIALADLASGMAVPIRAECGCGVHAGPPGFVWKHTKRSMAGPLFSLQVSFTTVKWGAIGQADASDGRRDHRSLLDDPGTVVVSCATAMLDTPQAAWAPLACVETPERAVVLMTTVKCRAIRKS